MKQLRFLFVSTLLVLGSCASLPFDSGEISSWSTNDKKAKGTVRIVSVSADKSGEWGSLEKEINDLLPLLFFEEGYIALSPSGRADYLAEVTVREREYADGWRTKRSLSAEVRLWAGEDSFKHPVPLSAGRALVQGRQSFASSKTTGAMLRKAVRSAVRGLPREDR